MSEIRRATASPAARTAEPSSPTLEEKGADLPAVARRTRHRQRANRTFRAIPSGACRCSSTTASCSTRPRPSCAISTGCCRAPALTPADPKAAARMDQVMNICDWYLFQGVDNVIGFQRDRRAAPDGA